MDKKNRTGLQSKISHIFAGVPVPKKKNPLSEHSESEQKDGIPDITQDSSDDFVIEQTVNTEQAANPNLKDDITEVSFSQEVLEYPEQDLQRHTEQKKIEPKPLEFFKKSPIDKQLEDELSQEQFKIISEPDLTKKTGHSENKVFKPHKEEQTSDSEPEVIISDDESSLENLVTPGSSVSVSQDKQPLVQKPSKEEIEDKKPQVKEVSPEPFVKKTKEEKSKIARSKNLKNSGIKDAIRTPKHLVSNVPGLKDETQNVTRTPGRKSLRTKGKNLKSNTASAQPKQKLMAALIIILPIVLVLVLLKNYGFFESSSNNPVVNQQPVSQVISGKKSEGLKINWPQPPVYPDGIRDPMGLDGSVISQTVITEHPDLDVKGTTYVEGGDYKVAVGNESFKTDTIIKDNQGREVKIIDIKKSQVTFEMASVFWIYDLDLKMWIQNNNTDILGTN